MEWNENEPPGPPGGFLYARSEVFCTVRSQVIHDKDLAGGSNEESV